MTLFHTHNFIASEKDPEMFFCSCGKTKDIHRHIWEHSGKITEKDFAYENHERVTGLLFKCKICGELKMFDIRT